MNKKLVIWALFIILLIIFFTPGVYANYQSIGTGSGVSTTPATWITGIRKMESSGKGMGLNETSGSNGLATTASNNIDVHMLKNTEYGAILLLGASDYGKQGSSITARRMDQGAITGVTVQASTTGNKYGIYEMGYYNMNVSNVDEYEWVAAGGSDFLRTSYIAPRYINRYVTTPRNGDALLKWHGASDAFLNLSSSNDTLGLVRGKKGAFSYTTSNSETLSSDKHYARAGVVCGTGF